MGSPQQPASEQYAQLERAEHLAVVGAVENVRVEEGKASVKFMLPRQAVSLLQFTW